MFQYAIARSLALKNKDRFYLDLTFLENNTIETEVLTPRKFQLDIFALEYHLASHKKIDSFLKPTFFQKLLKKINVIPKGVYHEKYNRFDPALLQVTGDIYLSGYWQSEKYFKDIQGQIRQDFTFVKLDPHTLETAGTINNYDNSVAIHIRRGDYINKPIINKGHGVCSLEYYKDAVAYINNKVTPDHYYLFSDDPDWVQQNLNFFPGKMTVVNWNKGDDSWKDMYLMSQCGHNIIANSSFSWWGAWLNNRKDKIVIAPKQWFAEEKKNSETETLIPGEWIRM